MSFFCAMWITQGSHEYGRDACARVEDDREASGAQRGPNASETSSQRFERSSTDFFFSYEKRFLSKFPQVGTIYASISKLIANRQEISPGIYCSKTKGRNCLRSVSPSDMMVGRHLWSRTSSWANQVGKHSESQEKRLECRRTL